MSAMAYGINSTKMGTTILKLGFSFLKTNFIETLSLMDYKAVEAYRRILFIDFIFPPAYAIFLSSIAVNVAQRVNMNNSNIIKVMLSCIFFDYIENIFQLKFLSNPEKSLQVEYFISAVSSSIKWMIALFGIFYIVYLIIKLRKLKPDM